MDMQCLMWSFGLIASVAGILLYDNAVIIQSSDLGNYFPLLTNLQPIVAMVSGILASVTSDYFIDRFPRVLHVFIYSVILGVTQVILIFKSDEIGVIIYAIVVLGLSSGYVWNLMVIVCSETMGVKDVARNWETMTSCYAFINIFTQFMFGSFYDQYADQSNRCRGSICFRWTFVVCTALCFISTGLLFVLWIKHRQG